MATYSYNIARGREAEFYNRVDLADPATAGFVIIPLAVQEAQGTGQDRETVATVLANSTEQTSGGWVRKTLTGASLNALAANHADNRMDLSFPAIVWTTPAAPNNVAALLIAYAANTGAATSTWIPVTTHTWLVTANGQNVTASAGNWLQC